MIQEETVWVKPAAPKPPASDEGPQLARRCRSFLCFQSVFSSFGGCMGSNRNQHPSTEQLRSVSCWQVQQPDCWRIAGSDWGNEKGTYIREGMGSSMKNSRKCDDYNETNTLTFISESALYQCVTAALNGCKTSQPLRCLWAYDILFTYLVFCHTFLCLLAKQN